MSLESEIVKLTAAMNRLAAGVEGLLTKGHAPDAKAEWLKSPIGTPAPAEVLDAQTEHSIEVAQAVTKQEVAAQAKPLVQTAAAEAAPTFDDAKKAFLAIAQKYGAVEGTAKSKDVLSRYGVPNLKALPVEQYPDFIALCDAVVAGGEA